MKVQPSLVSTYLYLLLNKLEFSESFYGQVRAIEGLAAVLWELGDREAEKILREAVKFEDEALLLDSALAEMREEIANGNVAKFHALNEVFEYIHRLFIEPVSHGARADSNLAPGATPFLNFI